MLHTLRGGGFDCLLTLISVKMEHPRPLQVCTIVCIIYDAQGARVIRVNHCTMHEYVVQPCYLSLTFGMIFLPDNLVGGQIEHLFKLFPAGSRGNRKSLVSEGYRSLWAET